MESELTQNLFTLENVLILHSTDEHYLTDSKASCKLNLFVNQNQTLTLVSSRLDKRSCMSTM